MAFLEQDFSPSYAHVGGALLGLLLLHWAYLRARQLNSSPSLADDFCREHQPVVRISPDDACGDADCRSAPYIRTSYRQEIWRLVTKRVCRSCLDLTCDNANNLYSSVSTMCTALHSFHPFNQPNKYRGRRHLLGGALETTPGLYDASQSELESLPTIIEAGICHLRGRRRDD
jgi:hypothetical protein